MIQAKASDQMKRRVTGIGGIFFKVKDPSKTKAWYQEHLGLNTDQYGTTFEWRSSENPEKMGFSQWSPMGEDTTYFSPSEKDFMVNYRVENLVELVKELKAEGVTILDEIEDTAYGKFVHILDPDGHNIELWEAVDQIYDEITQGRTRS